MSLCESCCEPREPFNHSTMRHNVRRYLQRFIYSLTLLYFTLLCFTYGCNGDCKPEDASSSGEGNRGRRLRAAYIQGLSLLPFHCYINLIHLMRIRGGVNNIDAICCRFNFSNCGIAPYSIARFILVISIKCLSLKCDLFPLMGFSVSTNLLKFESIAPR